MWSVLWYLLLAPVVGISLLVVVYLVWNKRYWERQGLPYLPPTFYWPHFFRGIFVTGSNGDADLAAYKKLSGMKFVGVSDMLGANVWILDPELMRNIFVKDFDHFVDRVHMDFGKEAEYMNLILAHLSGQQWKDVRNVMTPAFTSGKIKRMFPPLWECGDTLKSYFDSIAEKGEEVEVKDAYGRFTMDVIASTAFGVKCNSFKDRDAIFPKMANQLLFPGPTVFAVMLLAINFPKFLNFLRAIRVPLPGWKEPLSFFADVVKETLSEREKSGIKGQDFLQLMIDAKKGELQEEGESDKLIGYNAVSDHKSLEERKALSKAVLTEPLLVAQCILFFGAGYETTANTLAFSVYELALNPDLQEELYQEVKETVERHKGEVTYDAIMEMELLDKVISETLRLHTPNVRLLRVCNKDYQIPETNMVIKKGSRVTFPSFAIHRDEQYFPDPLKFDPERFSQKEKTQRNPYLYQPFGHGPRNCVGMRFAQMEAKAALATTVLHFRFHPSGRTQIPLKYSLTSPLMKAKNGVWLKIEKRDN